MEDDAATSSALEALRGSLLYSEELGIELSGRDEREDFKWFLAGLLFGARISETIAKNTYRAFERHGLLDPQEILKAGRDTLVGRIMAEGGYVRYDNRKSTQILRDCETLLEEYGGSLETLHERAESPADLEARIVAFYGAGPVTANIFLRELRPWWPKSNPDPLPVVVDLAEELGIDLEAFDRKSEEFARIEAGLIRKWHER